jgi:hypothetical protein
MGRDARTGKEGESSKRFRVNRGSRGSVLEWEWSGFDANEEGGHLLPTLVK